MVTADIFQDRPVVSPFDFHVIVDVTVNHISCLCAHVTSIRNYIEDGLLEANRL